MTADRRPPSAKRIQKVQASCQALEVVRRRPSLAGESSVTLLLALALLLRGAFLLLAGVDAPLVGDELAYQQIAENVATGRGFVQNNNPFFPGQTLYAWQAPLYPLSLAALYSVFGANPFVGKLYGILVGVATVYVSYDLARRVFANERIAWMAALFVAVYPGLLTSSHLLLSETLFTFLLVLAFDLLVAATTILTPSLSLSERGAGKRGWLVLTAAGAVWGAATLTRGITLYFILPLVAWFFIALGKDRWRAFPRALVFTLTALAVIAPWTLPNYTVFNQFVLLETKGGVNFWLGNSPFTPNDFIRNVW